MADISTYIAQIEVASRGEDVRDAIINALEAINDGSAWSGDDVPTEGSTHPITSGGAYNALARKQDKLTFDSTPAQNSPNPVTSGGIYEALQNVEGNIELDDVPTEGSTNAVTSGGVYDALQDVSVEMDEAPSATSEKAVKSRGIYQALRNIHLLVRKVSITLGTTWEGEGPYYQPITIANISANDKVDIQPGADALHQLGTVLLQVARLAALARASGREDAQAVKLHGDALRQQLGDTLAQLHEHGLDGIDAHPEVVLLDVLRQTVGRQRLAPVYLSVVLVVRTALRVRVLLVVDADGNVVYCHNL